MRIQTKAKHPGKLLLQRTNLQVGQRRGFPGRLGAEAVQSDGSRDWKERWSDQEASGSLRKSRLPEVPSRNLRKPRGGSSPRRKRGSAAV